ncbi:biopolymer transporter ExbD [Parahaliea mediterranea]|uniref:Biopolymer transporter ExbD n=1 Tax=Parahaliea mediterranea TaxID=651086 RepID=A0A939IJ23_9GAMM|nr:biopolymer transporter ExbD [Parahaliea mediterranea]
MRPSLQQRFDTEHAGRGIDLSPLLDVVFILLIFFIVTTVFVRETGVEIDKPRALSAQQLPQSVVLLAITDSGRVIHAGNDIGAEGVRRTLEPLLRRQQRPVVIQADSAAPSGLLVKVLDAAKLAGAADVSIATRTEAGAI